MKCYFLLENRVMKIQAVHSSAAGQPIPMDGA